MSRAWPIVVVIAACRFSPLPAAAPDAAAAQIVDDTAADFLAGSGDGAVVDPLGLLVPEAYAPGGLHARAYTGALVTSTTTWDELQAALPTATQVGEAYGVIPADWGGDRPHGLGLTSSDNFTIVVDGEVHLAGPTTLQLFADDDGFVELDLGAIRPLLRSSYSDATAATVTITPPHPGWYPIRGAMSENNGNAKLALGIAGAGAVAAPITADVLRARATDAQGLVVSGATDRMLASVVPATSVETQLARDWGTNKAPSYDLGASGQDLSHDFSLRFAGQLRIDAAGAYAFGFDVGTELGDYARIFVDGAVVASTWPGDAVAPAAVQLAAGWHDLVVDYADQNGDAQLTATITPPGGTPVTLGGAQLRPVRATGWLAAVPPTTGATWSTPGSTAVPLALAAPGGAVVDAIDAYFQLSPRASEVPSILSPAGGSDALALPATPAYDATTDAFTGRTALAGAAVMGMWKLAFDDAASDGSCSVSSPALIVTYHGGPQAPYATPMTYVSAPRPTPGARSIDAVHVTGDLAGAKLAIDLRTGDAQTIDAAPWVAIVDGAPPAVAPGALVEYRLTITGDGWHAPAIDKVEIDYTTGGS